MYVGRFVCKVGIYEAISVASCCFLMGEGISKLSLTKTAVASCFYNPFFLQTAACDSLLGGAGNQTRDKISFVNETRALSTTPRPAPLFQPIHCKQQCARTKKKFSFFSLSLFSNALLFSSFLDCKDIVLD